MQSALQLGRKIKMIKDKQLNDIVQKISFEYGLDLAFSLAPQESEHYVQFPYLGVPNFDHHVFQFFKDLGLPIVNVYSNGVTVICYKAYKEVDNEQNLS